MGILNRDAQTYTAGSALSALFDTAQDVEDAAFDVYEGREMCWRLARSLQADALDKGATPLTLKDRAEDVENARVELLLARKHLDDAIRDRIAVRRQMRAANDSSSEAAE